MVILTTKYNKMKKYYLLCLVPLLQACDEDANGELSLSPFGWIVLIGFIILFIIIIISGSSEQNKSVAELKAEGLTFSDFKKIGMYVGGHPELNTSINNVSIRKVGNEIVFFKSKMYGFDKPEQIENANIPVESISDVKLEDASTIERHISLGRLALVGIFAFAWKKKKKNEVAFLDIVWKKGKFSHDTIFMFQGHNALIMANTTRNELIKMCVDDCPDINTTENINNSTIENLKE